jgi:hypothetical protein
MTTPFNAEEARKLMRSRIEEHDRLAGAIRWAILYAVNPDRELTAEEILDSIPPAKFRNALADAVAELIGWENGIEDFSQLLSEWCDDDRHEDGSLV